MDAVIAPAGTVMLAGEKERTPGRELINLTVVPPAGAGELSAAVMVTGFPP